MTPRSKRSLVTALAAATIVPLLAACGPSIPLNVGTQDVPLSLALGRLETLAGSPLAPLVPGGGRLPLESSQSNVGNLTPTSPVTTSTAGPAAIAPTEGCPALNPLAPISFVPGDVSRPPTSQKYSYTTSLKETNGPKVTTYSGLTSWTVGGITAADKIGEFTYQVTQAQAAGANAKTSTYGVVPIGASTTLNLGALGPVESLSPVSIPPVTIPVALPDQPGLYLNSVSGPGSIALNTPLALVQFPIVPGSTFTAAGVSGGQLVTYTSKVVRQTKVNACGKPVGVWEIQLTGGTMTDLAQNVVDASFTETLYIDTSAGGLIVAEVYSSSGARLPTGVVALNESDTITVVPKADQ